MLQQDVLPLLDTPREAITTSALLRLPPSLPLQAKLERVEYLLELLVSALGTLQGHPAWVGAAPAPATGTCMQV